MQTRLLSEGFLLAVVRSSYAGTRSPTPGYTDDVASTDRPPASGGETREDDGIYDAPSDSCVLFRSGSARRIIDVRDHEEVVLGRSRGATFSVDDDRVSRRHLRIVCRDGTLFAEDLGSRNGTTLNGHALDRERPLQAGDELHAGPVQITVCGRRRTEVGDEGELFRRLRSEVERAVRYRRPLTVVGMLLAGPSVASREAMHRVAARVRGIDFVGEYAPGELLVLLPELDAARARTQSDLLLAAAREVAGVEAGVRVASVPESGSDADALIAAALGSVDTTGAPGDEPRVIAEDACTRALFDDARRAARTHATVLVLGETGSGKELVAAEIHRASARAGGPYLRLNCAALPETLVEAELFGHERGAFTGADRRRTGYIESASGGTLLFDEIGELPLTMQAKLLRVLEEHCVVRIGGTESVPVDTRFVAATNRNLEQEVVAGRFRQDLFFRLSPITIKVPPLRERPNDLVALAHELVRIAARQTDRPAPRLSPRFLSALKRYPWPGNVRELKNVIERAVVFDDASELSVAQLPERFAAHEHPTVGGGLMQQRLDEVERRNIQRALAETGGNRTHAAKQLGISRRALIYKVKKYGLGND